MGSLISSITAFSDMVKKRRCRRILSRLTEEVKNFKHFIVARNESAKDTVIALLNTTDINGWTLQRITGRFWSKYKFPEGIFVLKSVSRMDMQRALVSFDKEAAASLRGSIGFVVVVVNYGVAGVFPV
ncbi:MAG: hypothetical protein WC519_02755 [Parcubacteria group bacterium]